MIPWVLRKTFLGCRTGKRCSKRFTSQSGQEKVYNSKCSQVNTLRKGRWPVVRKKPLWSLVRLPFLLVMSCSSSLNIFLLTKFWPICTSLISSDAFWRPSHLKLYFLFMLIFTLNLLSYTVRDTVFWFHIKLTYLWRAFFVMRGLEKVAFVFQEFRVWFGHKI